MVKVRASRLAFQSATLADVQNALLNQPAHMVTDWGPGQLRLRSSPKQVSGGGD